MSPVLLLILLVLSPAIHACNARILKVDAKSSRALVFDVSSKGLGVPGLSETSVPAMAALPAIQGGAGAANGKQMSSEEQIEDADHQEKAQSSTGPSASDVVQDPSLGRVSWSVPRDGTTRDDPRFNVDYVGPGTHPPSHN